MTSPILPDSLELKRARRKQKRWTHDEAYEAFMARGLTPIGEYPGNTKAPWESTCNTCGATSAPTLNMMTHVRGGRGCKPCGDRQSGRTRTKWNTETATPVMLAAGARPLEPWPGGTNEPWRCECLTCGREVFPRLSGLARNSNPCAYCAGKKVDPDEAVEKMIGKGVRPLEPFSGTRKPWRCECLACGKEISPTYGALFHNGQGACKHCAGQGMDLEAAHADMAAAGLTPQVAYPGNNHTKWKCTCDQCGITVSPTLHNIRNGQGGCSNCAERGINYAAPGILYFVESEQFNAFKVGIAAATSISDRLSNWKRKGWSIIATWDTETAREAHQVEKVIHDWWYKEMTLPYAVSKADLPNGYSETVSRMWVERDEILLKVNTLLEAQVRGLELAA